MTCSARPARHFRSSSEWSRPHRRGSGRSRRGDGSDACDDARIPEDAPAIRQADRAESSLAAPFGGDADRAGAGPQHGDAAAMMVDEDDPEERAYNISMAKVGVGQAARF